MTETQTKSDALRVESSEESPVLHRVEVEVDAGRVKRAYDKAYRDLAQRVQVRGFRPGKTPRSVLERLYGSSLGEQIEHTLIAETLGEAVEQAGLEPVAEPAIESSAPRAGSVFRYTARIEVKPAIELPDLAGLPATRPRVEVGVAELETELEALRQRNAPVVEEPEGTRLEPGHVASIDFVGRVDGMPFEGGSGQGVEVEIGAGRFVPGFEEQLEGAASGEDREVTVTFPEDYANDQLAGKQAVFAVHVAAVKRRLVPELDDEFAKDLGEFGSLDELRARVRGDLTESRERAARSELHRTLMDSLIERASFDVPPGMVERQLQQQLQSAHQRLEGQLPHDALHEQLERWKEEWRAGAERQVRERLLLEAVARAEGLSVLPEDVEARIAEMAAQQGVDPARLRTAYGGEAFEAALESQLTDEKALEFLAARAKVEETTDT
jgi:trigger factor